jgi:acyl-CoA hydrolase
MVEVALPKHLQSCLVSHEEAIQRVVTRGARIASGFATSEPHAFYDRVWDHILAEDLTELTFIQGLYLAPHRLLLGDTMSSRGFLPDLHDRFSSFSLLANLAKKINQTTRKLEGLKRLVSHYDELRRRRIHFVAGFLGGANNIVIPPNAITSAMFPDYVERNSSRLGITDMHSVHFPDGVGALAYDADGVRKMDTFVLVMTPPDENGEMSHGPANGVNSDALERGLADEGLRILLYINPRYPFVRGYNEATNTVHADAFKDAARQGRLLVVLDDSKIPSAPANAFDNPDPREVSIAENVLNHIEQNLALTQGRSLQVGIGGTGVQVIRGLKESSWSGRVYTEMLEPFTWDLFLAGKIKGSHFVEKDGRRTQLDGKVVATFSLAPEGSGFYEKLDRNDAVIMAPSSRVVVSEGFYGGMGINNCLSIDFHGQVNSGGRGHNHHSGIGGAAMINRGLVNGGLAYLCLKSTFAGFDGKVQSSIMPFTPAGTPIALIGPDVTGGRNGGRFYLATEHGVVQLSGCSQSQLIKRLISVADPAFRDQLRAEAQREFRFEF